MGQTMQPDPERAPEVASRDRGYLPHWERQGAIYFVTFRLADSLPQHLLHSYEEDRQAFLAQAPTLSAEEKYVQERELSARIERALDAGPRNSSLSHPAVAQVVAETLRLFNGKRYHLFAWCIMPNHVHAVVQPVAPQTLAEILHSWKSFTAHEANKLLKKKGPFWQREYYDHLIRDERELWQTIEYVAANPLKANLKDWPWVEVNAPW